MGKSFPVVTGRRRVAHAAIGVLWLVVNVRFWSFWLAPDHRGALVLFLPATLAFAYVTTVLPSLYWFYVGKMRRPAECPPPPGRRVAMITLCVPSHESLEIIERQLQALPTVRYPHDSWVLDEGDDPRIRHLAGQHGVRYFTRKDVPRWNQAGPPFQARTKAGNVNAWLGHVAELGEDYEFFVQLDVDHIPRPEYLDRTLGHLADPQVAWVQAPSVFGNLEHWTARGAAEQDVVLQGPLQMGFYGHSGTPFIIGSHTTYRTAAVRAIGGFQPTRAEDHLDTVILAAAGYRGVYLPEVIAVGDGPEDFGTYLHQQFAWAYSMIQIVLGRMPRLLRRYRPRQALGFLMAQSWYTLWSLSLASLWILPVIALLSDRPIARVAITEFLAFHLAVIATSTLMWWWTRAWFQPAGVLLSWRGVILEVARWPIVLWAVANVVLGIQRPYMITDKGSGQHPVPPALRLYGPFFGLALIGIGAVVLWHTVLRGVQSDGYLGLVLLNVLMALVLVTTVVSLELQDLRARFGTLQSAVRSRIGVLLTLAAVSAAAIAVLAVAWAPLGRALR
jgi:cellulose synthase (UDP-forming)